MSASKPLSAAHLPGMIPSVAAEKPRTPRARPMSVCQVCSGGRAPKGGGTVVCLTCAATGEPAAAA